MNFVMNFTLVCYFDRLTDSIYLKIDKDVIFDKKFKFFSTKKTIAVVYKMHISSPLVKIHILIISLYYIIFQELKFSPLTDLDQI